MFVKTTNGSHHFLLKFGWHVKPIRLRKGWKISKGYRSQKTFIEVRPTIQRKSKKDTNKKTNHALQNTTQITKAWATPTSLKTAGELSSSVKVSSFCSTSEPRCLYKIRKLIPFPSSVPILCWVRDAQSWFFCGYFFVILFLCLWP